MTPTPWDQISTGLPWVLAGIVFILVTAWGLVRRRIADDWTDAIGMLVLATIVLGALVVASGLIGSLILGDPQ